MIKKNLISPFQKFAQTQSLSGILLFSATIIALIWANSPLSHFYESMLQYRIGIVTQSFELSKPLILWVNDGLMAIFFFIIGLEIKRELLIGELNTLRKATFPVFAAFGGMLMPLFLYIILNKNPEATHGWGIPMATDIAFSLAILKILGNKVPLGLKVFLTAFAIVDDIGAVLVIAIFYSSGINWTLLAIAFSILLMLYYFSYKKIHLKYLIFLSGLIIWVLFLKAGIHPTIAGVLMAFAIPIRQKIDVNTFSDKLINITNDLKSSTKNKSHILSDKQIEQIDNLEEWTNKVQSPLQLLEHRLHNWVAYLIMPVFALTNAGVTFGKNMNLDLSTVSIIAICLVLGNFIGITFMSIISVNTGLTELPKDVKKSQIIGVAFLGGVGFTMSIFIANLAFSDTPQLIDSAKVGIFIGSLISGLTGYLILNAGSRSISRS